MILHSEGKEIPYVERSDDDEVIPLVFLEVLKSCEMEVVILREREEMGGVEEVDECALHLPFIDWVGKCERHGRVHREVELHTQD